MKTIERNFIDELNAYLKDKNCYHTADVIHSDGIDKIYFEITWGDWKHDHLRTEYLVKQFCEEKGYSVECEVIVTEEDGSDTYSAEHRYTIGESQIKQIVITEIEWEAPKEASLPQKIVIDITEDTRYLLVEKETYIEEIIEYVSNYITEAYGYCHTGFKIEII